MSYLTLEVEIDNGKVLAKEPGQLPEKGTGLLTILHSQEPAATALPPLEALAALHKHLGLDTRKAADWMASVRDSRR
jgi:hypothetical protein